MIYAIFFKQWIEEEIIENENIHSQFIDYVPRMCESVEITGTHYQVIDVHYYIDEVETWVQIMLEEMKDQCK